MTDKSLPPWEDVLSAACRLQKIFPDAVLVRGTSASLHVHHRQSVDADPVLTDLRSHFDDVLTQIESVAGCRVWSALEPMEGLYPQQNGESPLVQLARQLSNPSPYDLDDTNLAEYKGLAERWRDWSAIVAENQRISGLLLTKIAGLPKCE